MEGNGGGKERRGRGEKRERVNRISLFQIIKNHKLENHSHGLFTVHTSIKLVILQIIYTYIKA